MCKGKLAENMQILGKICPRPAAAPLTTKKVKPVKFARYTPTQLRCNLVKTRKIDGSSLKFQSTFLKRSKESIFIDSNSKLRFYRRW